MKRANMLTTSTTGRSLTLTRTLFFADLDKMAEKMLPLLKDIHEIGEEDDDVFPNGTRSSTALARPSSPMAISTMNESDIVGRWSGAKRYFR
jgi:hypothetical protein